MARFLVVGQNYAPEPVGAGPYTAAYARALVAAGHRVTVITGYPHYPAWTVEHRRWCYTIEVLEGVRVIRAPHVVPSSPDAAGRAALEASFGLATLPAIARAGRIDAAIGMIPTLSGGIAARVAALASRARPGLLVQDLVSAAAASGGVPGAGGFVTRAVGAVERRLLRGVDVAVVARGFAQPALAMGARSVEYLPNFTTAAPATGGGAAATRARLGFPAEAFLVVYSGSLGYKQDFATVVTAAEQFRDDAGVAFLFIGEGSQQPLLQRAVAEGHVRGRWLPLQPAEDVPGILAAADVLLAPQRATEIDMSIPSKLTAYLRSGRPVLAAASHGSETAAQVRASGGGLVVPPSDPGALVDGIRALRGNPEGRVRMGAAGVAYAAEAFDRSRAEARFVTWAERLLAR